MTQLRLDAARLAADGTALYSIARSAASAARACESALGGTGGMAGDDESAEVFAHGQDGEPGYDKYSVDLLKAVYGMSNALRVVDAALGNTGRAYDGAQKVGAFKPASSSSIPEETPVITEPHASVPTALGKGPEGPLGEFGDFLKDALATLGVVLPSADRGKLSNAQQAWSELAGAMTTAQSEIGGAFTNASAMTLPPSQANNIRRCQTSLGSSFGKLSESATSMAGFAQGMIDAVDKAWEEIGWFIAQMAVEIAIEIGVGALLGAVTFGAGAAAMAAKIMLTVTRWAIKIAALCKKLRRLIMMALRAARMAVRGGIRVAKEAISAGLASAITTASFNTVRGALDPNYQPQNVLNAALSAAAGGAAGGGFSGAAGRLTNRVDPGAMQRVTHIAVETGGGAVDGLASGLAESGLNGTPFSPLSSMAAGALLGGALAGKPGGGGHSLPSTPGGPGNAGNISNVDVSGSDAPQPGAGDAGTSSGDGGGQVDIPNDGPQPGAGDAGTSSGDGGAQVDIPTDAPTGGAGDAGGGAGDGAGSVDIPTDASGGGSGDAGSGAGDGGAPSVETPSAGGDGSGTDAGTPGGTDAGAPGSADGTAPGSNDAGTPSGDGSAPSSDAGTPSGDGSAPSGDAGTPAGDGSAPSSDAGTPSGDAGTPAGDAGTPAGDAGTPSGDGSGPSSDAGTPSGDGTVPDAVDGTAPASNDAGAAETGAPTSDAGSPASPEASAPEAPSADGSGSNSDAPAAAAAGGASSTNQPANGSDGDAPAGDGTSTDADSTDADDGDANDGDSPEASDGDDPLVAPEDAAAIGGAAAAAGAATLLGKPSFLPTHTPGGASPAAPAKPAANGDGSSNGAPNTGAADGTGTDAGSSDAGSNDAGAPEAGSTPDAGSPEGNGQGQPDGSNGEDAGTPGNHSERTLDEIDQALNDINPNYDPSDPANGYATNCGNTSSNLNDFLNGKSSAEASTGTLDVPQMEGRTGNPQTPMTPEQIESSLRGMGAGSHCVVGIDRSTGDGHWFNAYFDGTTVWTLDAQTGSRSPWPPNEPNATNWDASIRPENVTNPDGSKPNDANATPDASAPATPASPAATAPATTTPTTHAGAPADGSAPDGTAPDGSAPDGSAPDGTGADGSDATGDGDRSGRRWPKWTPPVDRVDPSHASDGSDGAGTTYNGYDIPELTPEIRQELDALAAQPDSPIVKNDDGSYSLKDPIEVDAFNMSNDTHDWDEFQRQVGLQQQGINQLTVAEWRHNVDFYNQYNRVAKSEQAAANQALADAGVPMAGQAVLHGPDQVAGGRADRYDGAGNLGINSSLGNQWRHRIADLGLMVDAAVDGIDPGLRAHIHMNVHFGATDSVGGSPNATQGTLNSAQPVTSGPAPAGARTGAVLGAHPTPIADSIANGTDPMHNGASGVPGEWRRLPDNPVTPKDVHYGEPIAGHGHTSMPSNPGTGHSGFDYVSDHGAPFGRDDSGVPLTQAEYDSRYVSGPPKNWDNYPPNEGVERGTRVGYSDVAAFIRDYGPHLDRVGHPNGTYLGLCPDGVPATFEQRGLPLSSLSKPVHNYTFTGTLPSGWTIEISEIAKAFGREGGGIQLLVRDRAGKPVTVEDLQLIGVVK